MNYEVKRAILDKIKEYSTICIFRHIRNDGDCVGATKGMKALLQESFPEKKILLINGRGFNWSEPDHFRVVYLPRVEVLEDAMGKLANFLSYYHQT